MPAKGHSGFTMVEALVATAVFGLIMVGVFSVVASNSSVFNRGIGTAETHQNGRVALDRLTREIRVAGYDLSGVIDGLTNPTAVQTAEIGRLTFVADLDRDGVLDQVTYRMSGGQMLREISSWNGTSFPTPSSSALADGLSALTFSYFDDGSPNNPIAAPVAAGNLGNVRRISVSIVTTNNVVREQAAFPLIADVRLRN